MVRSILPECQATSSRSSGCSLPPISSLFEIVDRDTKTSAPYSSRPARQREELLPLKPIPVHRISDANASPLDIKQPLKPQTYVDFVRLPQTIVFQSRTSHDLEQAFASKYGWTEAGDTNGDLEDKRWQKLRPHFDFLVGSLKARLSVVSLDQISPQQLRNLYLDPGSMRATYVAEPGEHTAISYNLTSKERGDIIRVSDVPRFKPHAVKERLRRVRHKLCEESIDPLFGGFIVDVASSYLRDIIIKQETEENKLRRTIGLDSIKLSRDEKLRTPGKDDVHLRSLLDKMMAVLLSIAESRKRARSKWDEDDEEKFDQEMYNGTCELPSRFKRRASPAKMFQRSLL